MPADFRVVGTSPVPMSGPDFLEHATDAVRRFGRVPPEGPAWDDFRDRLGYVVAAPGDMSDLRAAARAASASLGGDPASLLYLSIPPMAVPEVVTAIGAAGLAGPGAKLIMEKPFGVDADSARALNDLVHGVFPEERVLRIDHFLGKEDLQNILAVRFANRMFAPVWTGEHVERIEIDVPETLGAGDRAAFYEQTGAFRDMVVTHLLQALGFLAMEPPAAFTHDALRARKLEVFAALRPLDPARVVRGQYEGYRDHEGVAPDSDTETLVAVEARIDTPRWDGVPMLLRTGKRMPQGRRVVTLVLREPEMHMFPADHGVPAGRVVFEIAEPGAIRIDFRAKEPGPAMILGRGRLDFAYGRGYDPRAELEAYERLLHDALLGDRTLFTSAEGIERLWEVAAPLLAAPPPVRPYAPGTWGPEAVHALAGPGGWHLPDTD
jgi:glucose-6-phosphate 1-dehydrogenase